MRIAITISAASLDLCLRKPRADKSPDYRDVIVSKSSVFKMFSVHTKTLSSLFKFLSFQERFPKAPFSVDTFSVLVWTEGLTGEIKLRFQIPPTYGGWGLELEMLASQTTTINFQLINSKVEVDSSKL